MSHTGDAMSDLRGRLAVTCAYLVCAAGWALICGTLAWLLMTGGPR